MGYVTMIHLVSLVLSIKYFFVFMITLLLLLCFYLDDDSDFVATYYKFSMSPLAELLLYKDDRFPDALTDVGAEAAVARGTLSLWSASNTLNSSISSLSLA
jgi:hypothetical protein